MKSLKTIALGSIVIAAMLFTAASVTATNVAATAVEIAEAGTKKKEITSCQDKDGNYVANANNCNKGTAKCIDTSCPEGTTEISWDN